MSQGWESRQQRTRAEILHAVGEIIAADGLDGLTMRKLADRAGVAVATLYNQFADRDGVLVAFVSSGLDQLEFELDEQPADLALHEGKRHEDGDQGLHAVADDPQAVRAALEMARSEARLDPYRESSCRHVLRLLAAATALRERERILNATGKIGKIGGWEHDLVTGKAVWTEALYDIIEILDQCMD